MLKHLALFACLAWISACKGPPIQEMSDARQAIAAAMVINERTVETYVAAIFSKLGLQPEPEHHRRVLAVLAWLQR